MKLDNCIRIFTEKYDEAAIKSLESFSNEIGMNNNYKIEGFDITAAFDTFSKSLDIYRNWNNRSLEGSDKVSFEQICENENSIIDKMVFTECTMKYRELPNFVRSYLAGVSSLIETADRVCSDLRMEDASEDIIGKVYEFCDHFVDVLDSKFYPIIENAVKGSGYYANKRLSDPTNYKRPIFL